MLLCLLSQFIHINETLYKIGQINILQILLKLTNFLSGNIAFLTFLI